jgi:hydroxypyruvate reductase
MSQTTLRAHARAIIDAALSAVDPAQALKSALTRQGDTLRLGGEIIDLAGFDRVIAVGAGKAGAPMAQALEDVLGDRLTAGRVVVKDGHAAPTRVVEIYEASHPVPDQRGVAAGARLAELLAGADARTLVFCLLSGGGSALMVAPAAGVSLADKQATTSLLLACGADIAEINAVRKHLSTLKGGGLARLAAPAKVVSLIVSDVVGERLDVIASGPTVADHSTWEEVGEIFERYGLWEKLPAPVRERARAGLAGSVPDTPKTGNPLLAGVRNLVIAGNRQALAAMALEARALGYAPLILSSTIEGETREVARVHAALAREVKASGHPLPAPCCLISGGETTVTMGEAHGKGGRNQEFALAAALDLQGLEGVLLASAGSDGTDGPTDAAGAWADGATVARAAAKGMKTRDFLARHDAYAFFAPLEDLIVTGPTRTNVMDVRLALIA